ncbi:MAG TPA: MFS transporter [Burkholderiaceae bacterium]|nr:MFS transporter [Burkholderiaceae bacterium]
MFGALYAAWGVHVPSVKLHYEIGEQALAGAMLTAAGGGVLVLTRAGRIVGRFGPRSVALLGGQASAAALALLLMLPSYPLLLVAMLVFGVASGLFDVSINAEASELERRAGRPMMSGFHAMFSLGGMAGASAVGVLQRSGISPLVQLWMCGGVAALAIVWGCALMLRMPRVAAGGTGWRMPKAALLLIGALTAVGFVAEGAMYDWSVLYMRQEARADAGTAALAYASFSGAMAAGRFGGDAVRARLAPVGLLRLSAAVGGAGMAMALLAAQPVPALVGFALVGLGFANIVPVLYSAAGRVPGVMPAQGIATVSALGYLGIMGGPPLIGFVAQHSRLGLALWIVVAAASLLAAAAGPAMRFAASPSGARHGRTRDS